MKDKKRLIKQTKVFIKIGVTSVLIDFFIYSLLISFNLNSSFSKFLSYISGATFSYFANKNWTFKSSSNIYTPITFSISYLLSLLINVFLNDYILSFSENKLKSISLLAFFIATISSATVNFLSLKFFVFHKIRK